MSLSSISPVRLITIIQARVRGHQLLEAAGNGDSFKVKLLLARGKDVNATDNGGNTALHWAAKAGKTEVVEELVKAEADVNVTNIYGDTALHEAVDRDHLEIVKLLLAKGADIDAKGRYGWTALYIAAKAGKPEVVEALVKAGADVNATNKFCKIYRNGMTALRNAVGYGMTALHNAVGRDHLEIVKLLLVNRANINATDNGGNTTFQIAALCGFTDIVKVLVRAGADVNVTNKVGNTALHMAAHKGYEEIVKLLVNAGANVDTKNNRGETALQMAKRYGRYDNVNKAIEAGKKELIAQLGALEKEHIEKSVELSNSLRISLFKLSNTNNEDSLYSVLKSNAGKRTLGLCFLEPKLRLKKARQYSAEAATKIQ